MDGTQLQQRPVEQVITTLRVEVVDGPDKGKFATSNDVLSIGTAKDNGLAIGDFTVSRYHLEVTVKPNGLAVSDLGSTNGSYIGRAGAAGVAGAASVVRIERVLVQPGALIKLGGTTIRLEDAGRRTVKLDGRSHELAGMLARSPEMVKLFSDIERVAVTQTSVLVVGESGTGKERVAEAIHQRSPRAKGPLVTIDCGALASSLLASELFGHERGAFTGATGSYAGAFERAHGGTVFLDEIGELPLNMQPKLLRVLERKEVRRVGGTKTIEVDVRIVAATNRDLGVEVNRGRFREDLYYRLAVARVHVPALRDRKDDLQLLIEHILTTTPGGETAVIAQETIDLMMKHDWPGNVRELRNVIERAVLLAENPTDEDSLRRAPAPVQRSEPSITVTPSQTATSTDAQMTVPVDVTIAFKTAKQNVISEFERRYISRLLAQHDGNISAAARAAGIDRMSIHKMLHRLGLANPGRE